MGGGGGKGVVQAAHEFLSRRGVVVSVLCEGGGEEGWGEGVRRVGGKG